MRIPRSHLMLLAALGSMTVATMASAQVQPPRPRRGPPAVAPGPNGPNAQPPAGPNRGGMRGPRGTPAAMLLAMREQLALTPEQVQKLEALQAAPLPASNASDRLRARADLMDATRGDGDLGKARAALDRMHKLRTDEAIARLKARQDARAVLTAAQKTTLDNMRQQFAGRGAARGMGRGRGPGQAFRGRGPQGPQGRGMGPGAWGPQRPGMGPMGPGMGPGMMGPQGPGMGQGMGPISGARRQRGPGADRPLPDSI